MFPGGRSPRVLWAGVDGEATALQGLRDAVESAMVGAGETPEPREFRAHLTIARVPARLAPAEAGALAGRLRAVRYGDATGFCVGDVSLMRSELGRGGAAYTRLAQACRPLWSCASHSCVSSACPSIFEHCCRCRSASASASDLRSRCPWLRSSLF